MINLWLSSGLIIAVLSYAVISGMLILKLGNFEYIRHKAKETESELGNARNELSTLRHEVDALEKQREILAPTIADWEKRLKEKAEAEAALATLESKRRQTEAANEQAIKRLEDTNKDLVSTGKQKAELDKEIEKLKAENLSLTKAITTAKVTWDQAMEAERRFNAAQNALINLTAPQKQLETDIAAAQRRLDQIRGEADDARKVRENLAAEQTVLRQQAEKQRIDLGSEIEKLKIERDALTKAITAAKVTWDQAMEAERRLKAVQNELVNLNPQLEQMKADVETERKRRDQIQGEADDARKVREKLDADTAMLRQQTETLKGEKTDIEKRVSDLKAIQATVQQEERKLEQTRKEVTDWEHRRDTAKDDAQKAESALFSAQKHLQETSTKQGELTRESSRLEGIMERFKSDGEQLTQHLEKIRQETTDWERRRDAANTDMQKADSDLSAARKLYNEMSAQQGELVRESSRLESIIEQRKKEKDALEKELGHLESQQPQPRTGRQ